MEKKRLTNFIKRKYFSSEVTNKTEIRGINGVKEEINEIYVDAQTTAEISDISLQGNSIAEVAKTLTELEQNCILIPSYAKRVVNEDGNSEWSVQVRGWAFGTRQSRKKKLVLGMAKRFAGVNKDDEESREKSRLLEERFSMFLAKNLRNQEYKVQIISLAHPTHMELDENPDEVENDDEVSEYLSETSTAYQDLHPSTHITSNTGHFCGNIKIPVEIVDEWVDKARKEGIGNGNHVRLLKLGALPKGREFARPSFGFVSLIESEGISVISDIDDTIKLTEITSGPRTALSNTFLYDLVEVPGMADVYMEWYNKGASIHYVSNSPWQLFPMLKQFIKRFPPGSAHLKFYNDLLKSFLFEEPGLSKINYIKEILEDFPNRKFILIGDSAKQYPSQILHVFIRDVSTERLRNIPSSPTKRNRSFPYILKRSLSSTSLSTKSMPPVIDTSLFNNNSNSINAWGTDDMVQSPDILTPNTPTTPTTPTSPMTPTEIDNNTHLQQFLEKVKACKESVPNNAFTLFKDSYELRDNEIVNSEFDKLLEKQQQRVSRQNTQF
ncbi:11783_t:CDS:2 [Funneliformis geosporum]|uniref:12633_t:CDS:1 n=1 Tax=Funneliformis geosporum TaxID=1117311 RepID=A0A9W4SDT5_9GLOM|nr:11783_t:CDS:2 [Funneliformis geosporum]CAI2164837.1 12633_t:CDS:2 [Funneliformis geosporum]